MTKGNLYLHLVPKHSYRLDLLQKLKHAWRAEPRDFEQIKELQTELNRFENKKSRERTYG